MVVIGVIKTFFIVLLLIVATSSKSLLVLLGPYHFCPLLCPSLHEIFPDISNFPEEISSLPHSIVFLYSLHCSFKKAFLCPVGILWFSAFSWVYLFLSPLLFASLLSQLCKASSDNHFAFLHFSFFGIVLVTASCTML